MNSYNIKNKKLKYHLLRGALRKGFLWGLVVISFLSQIYFALRGLSYSGVISQIESEKIDVIRENKRLTGELVRKASLSTLTKKASELGFGSFQASVFIGGELKTQALR